MISPCMLCSQDRLDPCHHGWAMDACFQFSVSERIRPWTSCWLSHGCSVLTADSTLLWLGCGCSASQKPLMLSLLGGCSVLDVIMAGPWMLYSQNRLSPGRLRTDVHWLSSWLGHRCSVLTQNRLLNPARHHGWPM